METLKVNSDKIHGQLSVFVFKDNQHPAKDVWIAYCPELDLAGYDHGEKAAKESLKYVLSDYFDYALKHNTLEKDLLSYGWRKYKDGKLIEPSYKDLVKDGKLDDVISQETYTKDSISVNA